MNNKYIDNKLQEFRKQFGDLYSHDGRKTEFARIDGEIELFIKEALEEAIDKGYNDAVHQYLLTLKSEQVVNSLDGVVNKVVKSEEK